MAAAVASTQQRMSTAPAGLALSGTRCVIFSHHERAPLLSFDTIVSSGAIKAQLEAQQRVRAWRAAEREYYSYSMMSSGAGRRTASFSKMGAPAYYGKKKKSSDKFACGLTGAEILALQSRELTPEDYEILLQLDESVEKRNVLSELEAAALIESTVEGQVSCSVCLCDLESGESAVLLSCGHCFHPPCIKSWLVKGKDTCPLCNAKAEQDLPAAVAGPA